ncbi:hypothetical protein [Asanoa ishikariensis]|uniref:hypothetical protein n=1 Tax=Asanoa ishikariensis TaxID=137265 RepID=UPI00115FA8B5|nr:hypothetical protein [Asanoa ishikariensis]
MPISTEPILADLPTGPVLARPSPRPSAPRPHLSLLAPRSTTAILQYLLSRLVADGPVDVAAVIEQIAAGRPLPTLPRRPQRTLRFGAEILVDLGEHMRPFRRDQADVVAAARAVVGVGSSSVRYFADAPLRGIGPGRRAGWTPGYSPPAAGTAVLLLTDLGIGGDRLSLERASVPEWLRFLRLVGRAGCRPVALVPYPPERWPSRLRALCPMLTWDRDVTVGTARTAVP